MPARPLPLERKGVYLITGGHGGIGSAIAEFLAKEYAARLVLVGRSCPSTSAAERIVSLQRYGAEVLSLQTDVSDLFQVENAIRQAVAHFGHIDGVIHSAGVLRDGFLLTKSWSDFQTVLAPKVAGTENLLHALSGERLKFVALLSSLAGVLGNSGQADYAYANAFLDNFAALWKGSVPVVSINWPYWREGGMRLSERAQRQMTERSGLLPLEREQGLAAFRAALTTGETNVLVAAGDRHRIDKLLASSSKSSSVVTPAAQPHVMASVLKAVGEVLKLAPDRIKTDQPLSEYGMDSVAALQTASSLKNEFGPQPETLLFEYTTVEAVARHLAGSVSQAIDTTASVLSHDEISSEDIAIIGLAGRYAFADSLSELWTNLSTGRDCVIEIPPERWSIDSWHSTGKPEIGKSISKWGSFLSDVDCFDPRFFGITPREAELIDPQERVFLEVAWHALEDAALTRQSLANCSVGVFAGAMWSHYQLLGEAALEQGRPLPASSFSSIANRLSYFGGFRGPSLTVDTMCSSSLTAIHLAAESLRRHECDTAVAGAVNLALHPHKYVLLSQGNFVSPTGRCRSFGENADGYVPGEGAGAVVLKRLAEAVRDGDPIRAVIKATAINHGGRSTSYSVPNAQAQAALLRSAWERAGDSTPLTYIEAHGTGTSLGDPLEIAGLRQALQELGSVSSCRIGSIKSNLGHLEAAAGIAGLTKAVLQLEYRQLTPSLHADPASSKLNFGGLPLEIQTRLEDWLVPAGSKRRAGVSSFGAGGSNAHLVIDEYVSALQVRWPDRPEIVVLSARTVESLRKIAEVLANFVEEHRPALQDLCWTLQVGREIWEERAAFVANDLDSVVAGLRELATTGSLQNGFRARAQKQSPTATTNLSLEKRAELWTLGSVIDWKEHHSPAARRISLPGYQFARERYWIITNQPKPTPSVTTPPSQLAHLRLLLGRVAQLQPEEIDPDTNFADLGLDSILQREFVTALERETGPLPSTLLWEHPTLSAVATYLGTLEVDRQVTAPEQPEPPSSALPIVNTESEDIAIIGLHGRYPGAENLDEFWKLLQEGRSSIKSVPPTRWSTQTEGVYCQAGAFLDGVDQFDPLFFGITPVEAAQITPEERLLLESAWACLEDAGYARQNCRGHSIGVFVGATTNTYPLVAAEAQDSDGVMAPDTATYSFANRISYVMDWQGPSLTIDTACSSALVAIQLACDSLKRGECEAALASSVNLYLHPAKYKRMCQGKLLAREAAGLFAAEAEGFIPGEGVGSVLLKPFTAALRDQDPIHGVIRGIKVRHKGRSNGFLAPSAAAEKAVISETLSCAGLDSSAVQYLELQATGAAGTDTLEINALRSLFSDATFGSLKPNIGHLEAASGMAALTKVLLQMKHGCFAPVRVAKKRHQELQLTDSDLHLPEKLETWAVNNGKRRAGLGSFGAGGLNAYLIVEESPPRKILQPGGEYAVVLSAPSSVQLHRVEQQLADYLDRHSDVSLPAMAWTLQSGREEFSERAAIVVSTVDELRAALREGRLIRSRVGRVVVPDEASTSCDLRNAVSLWLKGARLDWRRFYSQEIPVRLSLPHYPFERVRCWIDARAKDQVTDYYDITAKAVADEPLMLTFAPFPERIPGFHWLSAMADGAANPEWRDLVIQRQCEMRQVAFRCIDWTKVKRVLDIGCGFGIDLVRLLNEHPKITGDGFTISAAQAAAARKLVHQNKLTGRCDIHCADSATAPFPGSYDLIFGFEVTFHIREKQALFSNIAGHLAPGGRIVLTDCVATTATPLHASHLGQFTSNESEWVQVLSTQGLCLKQVIDVTPQIANFLCDPDFESHLQALSTRAEAFRKTEAEHRGWHRFGQALEDGLIRYTILEITRDTGQDSAELAAENLRQLQHPASYSELQEEDTAALERVTSIAAAVLQIPKERLDPDQPFSDYGVNSLVGLRLLDRINKNLGLQLEVPVLYSAPTLRALSAHVPGSLLNTTTSPAIAPPSALPEFEPIAVIGMAGRFPGARNVGEFWRNLATGYDAVCEVPGERWNWREYFDPVPTSVGRTYSRWGGFLEGATEFDPAFFRITPADAEVMDPQQRLFLQICWQALEDAGYTGERVQGARCGVMAGVLESDFGQRLDVCANPTRVAQGMLGNAPSILAARIAYFLNLKGLAVSINTACSSSLVGVHLACQSLRSRETDLMLAGGVSLYLDEQPFIMMSKAGMLSPTGKCRAFDAQADGIVVGEAAAAVVLKRLSDAQRDGDIIYGVIEGTGTNQDGTTNGITAPNGDAQRELEQSVLRQAGRSASSISYIECHGTGTRLGDPVEVQAIQQAYQGAHKERERCALGAVKSNIGHTSAAAGVVGLIKVLLALRHKQIPPSLHVDSINPLLQINESAFYINRELQSWEPNGEVRVAGINSFGYSGTNAHVLVTESSFLPVKYADEKGPFLIPLSARDEEDLRRLAQELADYLGGRPARKAGTQPVKKILSDVLALPVSEISDDTPVADLGWDTHYLVVAARQFTQELGVSISAGDLLASGTVAELCSKLRPSIEMQAGIAAIAATFQCDREAFVIRAACIAGTAQELYGQLKALA
ncbi:MAG: SDR family NAD(P)-dependent oxidoreductase, partial [Acidobacteriaceae bacterium]|nr:SDR family NAD(P)-dependent oxidoreductase [Acidobacteriaceae bacterium]